MLPPPVGRLVTPAICVMAVTASGSPLRRLDRRSVGSQMSWQVFDGLVASVDSLFFRNADGGASIVVAQAVLTDGDPTTSRASTEYAG